MVADQKHAWRKLAQIGQVCTRVGKFVCSMLDRLAAGETVIVLRADDEVTPGEAARILGVTRQCVDRLCADEMLAFRRSLAAAMVASASPT